MSRRKQAKKQCGSVGIAVWSSAEIVSSFSLCEQKTTPIGEYSYVVQLTRHLKFSHDINYEDYCFLGCNAL
jgi:hypothetical protein